MIHILLSSSPLDHVVAHPLGWDVGPLHMTNHMLMALVAGILMVLIFPVLFRKANLASADAPRGARNFFESILEFLRVEVFRPALKEHTDRFVPFLWTLFFFILFCNLLGQLPIGELITLVTGKPSHYGGTATGSLVTTATLAVCAFLFIHVNGVTQVARSLIDGTYGHHGEHEEHSSNDAAHDMEHARSEALAADVPGDFTALANPTRHYEDDEHVRHQGSGTRQGGGGQHGAHAHGLNPVSAWLAAVPLYLWNFAPHPFKPGPGESKIMWVADVGMWLFLLILESVGALIKPFALMIRLFANMIAGHIVLASLVGLIVLVPSVIAQIGIGIPVTVLSLLIRVLELFVAFLQAYIFTFLTTLFIASAVAPEH